MNSRSEPPPLPGERPAEPRGADDPRAASEPVGPARRARFDGVLSGVRGEDDAAHAAVRALIALGVGAPSLELDGGRYSLLAAAEPFDPRRAAPDVVARVAEILRALAASGPSPRAATSTFRCVEWFDDVVRETAFVVRDGVLHAPSRTRPATEEDRRRSATPSRGAGEAVRRLGPARAAAISALVLALGVFLVMRSELWAGMTAPPAASLARSTGAFGDAIAFEVATEFPEYVVTLRRGPGYPRTREAAASRAAAADTPEERAAVAATIAGGDVFLRLEASDGAVLRATRVSLRALLVAEDAVVTAPLGANAAGARVSLSMAAGR